MPITPRMFIRMSERDRRLIAGLKHKWGLGDDSETIRAAIRRSAEREGIHEPALSDAPSRGPFGAFTKRARNVVTLAQEEADRMAHNYLGTEHILLGLIREGGGIAAQVLTSMGVELSEARKAVEDKVGEGQHEAYSKPQKGDRSLTPRAKRAIGLATDEARRLGHDFIGTEHLLLGLLHDQEGVGAIVLNQLGATHDKVRREVMEMLSLNEPSDQPMNQGDLGNLARQSALDALNDPAFQATV